MGAANPHLATTAPGHERLAAQRKPDNGRADLSPELWALIAEHGYSATAESRQWRTWMLGCIDGDGHSDAEVKALLGAREARKSEAGTPSRDRLWSWGVAARWRKSIVDPMRKAVAPEVNPYDFTAEDLFNDAGAAC